ncbi:O-antigen polysaccharide polymerase Wzy [Gordonia desulfuricans]|uniref:O-antigen polysaccharide polymerase Wzy n=1 Tax=Gordonia desulfuricans TaxID=89051 RepID=A0A7K3LTS2_9ACTN|nr:O-antigen polysaccharide polymerase Wzy [Gordonia desulfuricans]NDK91674.1 O-antigen polysaccharide polymerase Wzy [Gordonia desulfuricans]
MADSRYLSASLSDALTNSLHQALLFLVACFGVYWLLTANRGGDGIRERVKRRSAVRGPVWTPSADVTRWAVVVASAVALICVVVLVSRAGGIGGYFGQIANRSSYLRGSNYLVYSYLPLLASCVVHILSRRRESLAPGLIAYVGVSCLFIVTFVSGGRGPLIFGGLIPMLLVFQTGKRPLSIGKLVGVLAIGAVGAMAYSVKFRESQFATGDQLGGGASISPSYLFERFMAGTELRPVDSLIRLNEANSVGQLDFQNGSTYAASLAWFVPRAAWASKPGGGANTWFTQRYLPRFYGSERVETSISAVGEAFANFSWLGVIVAGMAFGLALFGLRRSLVRSDRVFQSSIVIVCTPYVVSLMRGDLYQNLGQVVVLICIVAALCWIGDVRSKADRVLETKSVGIVRGSFGTSEPVMR